MPQLSIGPRADRLLTAMWQSGGTDLILTAGMSPQIRVDGSLVPATGEPTLTTEDVNAILGEINGAPSDDNDTAERDFSFDWGTSARIRGNAFRQRGKTAVALRMIPADIPSPTNLGLPSAVVNFATLHQGLVLVTGPTGSGKSTTLASLIDQINTNRACHIITIEDPIEYVHAHKRSAVSQREVGTDTESFAHALRAALREDPDVILVGEMRDLESIRFALTLAETGHLVFATLHTNDSAQAVARVVDVFPAEQQAQIRLQLSAALTGIVHQRLLPRIGGGMVAAFEVLLANQAVRHLIKESKTHQLRNALVTGAREGMMTLEHSLSARVAEGLVHFEDAVARSIHPRDVHPVPTAGLVAA